MDECKPLVNGGRRPRYSAASRAAAAEGSSFSYAGAGAGSGAGAYTDSHFSST